jgi:hypothetical protein
MPRTPRLEKLVSLGGAIRSKSVDAKRLLDSFGQEARYLLPLLELANGLYAFESALHVYSDLGTDSEHGLLSWNRPDVWRQEYQGAADRGIFFAEDIFGHQFSSENGAVFLFDTETDTYEPFAADLEDWASVILEDFRATTGHPLAHEWQAANGPLPLGQRLAPKIPFVLGGEYSASNLYAIDTAKALRFRASLAGQIRDLPDGTQIKFTVVD